jgi:hypothetical protein
MKKEDVFVNEPNRDKSEKDGGNRDVYMRKRGFRDTKNKGSTSGNE